MGTCNKETFLYIFKNSRSKLILFYEKDPNFVSSDLFGQVCLELSIQKPVISNFLSFTTSRDIYVQIFHNLLEILKGSVICQRKEGPRKDEQSLVAHCPFFSYRQVPRQYGKERLMLTLIQAHFNRKACTKIKYYSQNST